MNYRALTDRVPGFGGDIQAPGSSIPEGLYPPVNTIIDPH